tara:strand:+ start:310 stop:696 length:387 start_codon:yes stop_codon:yes gene_type:complete
MPPETALFLPPGVVQSDPSPPVPSGPPFGRSFFENVLPQAINSFCTQVVCESPIVELYTVDGGRLFVKAISGVSDTWVALHTKREEYDQDVQVFIPYTAIFRVDVHPQEDNDQGGLGFLAIMADEGDA